MDMYRSVFDKRTGTHLVYPDALVLRNIESDTENGRTILSMDVALEASKGALAHFAKSRQIVLSSIYFSLSRPKDPLVKSFHFAKSDDLIGRVVIASREQDSEMVLEAAKSNPLYLNPEYNGTTEEYVTDIAIASVRLIPTDLKGINDVASLPRQVDALKEIIEEQNEIDNESALDLCARVINEHGEIENSHIGGPDDAVRNWAMILPHDKALTSVISEEKLSAKKVFMDESYFGVIIE